MEHILNKNFGINSLLGSALIALLAYFLFLKNIEGITKVNSLIIPILIVIVLIVGIKNILNIDTCYFCLEKNINLEIQWLIQALIYASYNLLLLIPVLVNVGKYIKNKRQTVLISVFSRINYLCFINFCFFSFSKCKH